MGRCCSILLSFFAAVLFVGCSGASSSSGSSGGNGGSGGTTTTVAVSVSPSSASLVVSQSLVFQATVTGSTNTAVTWQVNGVAGGNSTVGTITAGGSYTAPAQVPNPAAVSVTAVARADTTKSGSASVTIVSSNSNQAAQSIPVKLGTSGGNASDSSTQGQLIYCCGGTLGSLLQRNGTFYILSNNHVLARSDSASIGDAIIQPGLIDANCSQTGTTTVGNLTQFVNLQAGSNVDAAIAQIVSGTVDTGGNILSLGATATGSNADPGPPHAGSGITANLGEAVAKSGRTTGLTCSVVDATGITDSVSYQTGCGTGSSFTVTYSGQISVSGGSFSASGDSGSLVVDSNTADPVMLLYGGSDTDTVGNPVSDVLNALQDGQGNVPTFVGSSSTHQVIGCTLASDAVKTTSTVTPALTAAQIAQAQRARDMHAPELLANPYIQGIGVGASIDHPGEPAVVLVVNENQIPAALPDQLEGIATRIVPGGSTAPHGVFEIETANRIAPAVDAFAAQKISDQNMVAAKAVQAAHVDELMKQPGVQGVGITSSADAPGEAALMIFVIRGVPRNAMPVLIDGVRTRIRESSRFTAGQRGQQAGGGCQLSAPQASSANKSVTPFVVSIGSL
jgi:hypothetical protein